MDLWEETLRDVFDLPASVVMIRGTWKTGKTDFSLYIAEELLRLKVIDIVATNIYVSNLRESFKFITNIPTLRAFLFNLGDKRKKLYIYDESVSSTSNRRAMSKLNVEWLEIIPELSKGRAKVIAICHTEDYLESVFYNPTFLRAIYTKLDNKRAILESPLLKFPQIKLNDIPRTSLTFDPYRIAVFRHEGDIDIEIKDQATANIIIDWLNDPNFSKIGRIYKMHPNAVRRIVIDEIKRLILLKGADVEARKEALAKAF